MCTNKDTHKHHSLPHTLSPLARWTVCVGYKGFEHHNSCVDCIVFYPHHGDTETTSISAKRGDLKWDTCTECGCYALPLMNLKHHRFMGLQISEPKTSGFVVTKRSGLYRCTDWPPDGSGHGAFGTLVVGISTMWMVKLRLHHIVAGCLFSQLPRSGSAFKHRERTHFIGFENWCHEPGCVRWLHTPVRTPRAHLHPIT